MKKILHKLFGLGILSLLWLSTFMWLANAQGLDTLQDTKYNPSWLWAETLKWDSLITSIKTFINRVLGLLALITLVILLRWGFQMITAAWDETKYKAWFKILKQAAFGLAFIALSRLMVSLIFFIIAKIAG